MMEAEKDQVEHPSLQPPVPAVNTRTHKHNKPYNRPQYINR